MNELIQSIFQNFTVDGEKIPVCFLRYNGHKDTYVTYMQYDMDASLSGDDDLIGYVDYYDFDVYSKGNYSKVIEQIKQLLKDNGFVWQVSRTSPDMFEDETKLYHKTLCFAIYKEEN